MQIQSCLVQPCSSLLGRLFVEMDVKTRVKEPRNHLGLSPGHKQIVISSGKPPGDLPDGGNSVVNCIKAWRDKIIKYGNH